MRLSYLFSWLALGVGSSYASSIATSAGYFYTGLPFAGGLVPASDFYRTTNSSASAPAASGVVSSTSPLFPKSVLNLGGTASATAGLVQEFDPYLKISGSVGGSLVPGGFVSMSASVSDTLTLAGGPANGTLQFLYTLNGSAISSEGFGALTRVSGDGINISLNGTDPIPFGPPGETSVVISDASSFSVPFVNGSGSYTLTLKGMVACVGSNGNCESILNLGDTLNIVGLKVLNSSGSVVSNVAVTSQSGLNYLALPGTIDSSTAVPEPRLWPLAIVAAILALGAKRRDWLRATAQGIARAAGWAAAT